MPGSLDAISFSTVFKRKLDKGYDFQASLFKYRLLYGAAYQTGNYGLREILLLFLV